MVALAAKRLAYFGPRAVVRLTGGDMQLQVASGTCDRFLSTYVLDLLSEEDMRSLIAEASRVLAARGLLALVSLTHGCTPLSLLVERTWRALYALHPRFVGGGAAPSRYWSSSAPHNGRLCIERNSSGWESPQRWWWQSVLHSDAPESTVVNNRRTLRSSSRAAARGCTFTAGRLVIRRHRKGAALEGIEAERKQQSGWFPKPRPLAR
jgi:hypothetical protein